MSAVVFADVHGQVKLLNKLLVAIKSKHPDADIYSTGDLIDRGPESKGVIQLCIDHGVKCNIGNHEEWLRELIINYVFEKYALEGIMGGKSTFESYGVDPHSDGQNYFPNYRPAQDLAVELLNAMPKDHKQWIADLPLYRKISVDGNTYWLTHAGVQDSQVAQARYNGATDDDSVMEYLARKNDGDALLWSFPNFGSQGKIKRAGAADDNLYWFNDGIQIMGHTPIRSPMIKSHFAAIDTGCGTCHPYKLTGLVLPTMEILQVTE